MIYSTLGGIDQFDSFVGDLQELDEAFDLCMYVLLLLLRKNSTDHDSLALHRAARLNVNRQRHNSMRMTTKEGKMQQGKIFVRSLYSNKGSFNFTASEDVALFVIVLSIWAHPITPQETTQEAQQFYKKQTR